MQSRIRTPFVLAVSLAMIAQAFGQTRIWSEAPTTQRWSDPPATQQWSEPATTKQWSEPTTTKQWAETPATQQRMETPATQQWAAPTTTQQWAEVVVTEQIDPSHFDRAKEVPNPGPLETRLVGEWELWVPGGFWYSSDGRNVYQHYTPGAAMNRLVIRADGSYRWASAQGRLVEVRPWHAQPDRRYYRVQAESGSEYEIYWDSSSDRLLMLFGGVGGHAATGSRVSGTGR